MFSLFDGYLSADGGHKTLGTGEKAMIWSILIIGTVLRLVSLNQSLWLDEAINVLATQKYSLFGMITEYARADFHPPGYFVILWFWARLFGTSEYLVRIPSLIFGLITIYTVYLIGQKLHSKTLGLISALLLAINPLHIYYSQEARMYSLATAAVVLNFLLFIKLIKQEKVSLVTLVLSNLLVLSSDYVAYLIYPAQLFFLLITKQKIKDWLKGIGSACLIGLLWMPVFISQISEGFITSRSLPVWKNTVGGFDLKAPVLTLVKFIIGRVSISNRQVYFLTLLPICTLFVFLILKGIRNGKNLLLAWLLVPIFSAFIISLVIPIYSYFRLLFILPAFIILLSLGIVSFKGKLKKIFLAIVIFIEIIFVSMYLFIPGFQREDWKGLVAYLRSTNNQALVVFESTGSFSPFDYYAKGSLRTAGGLKTFLPSNEKDIYLIDYLVDIFDKDRKIAKDLIGLGYKLVETKDFHGVGFVYHYAK